MENWAFSLHLSWRHTISGSRSENCSENCCSHGLGRECNSESCCENTPNSESCFENDVFALQALLAKLWWLPGFLNKPPSIRVKELILCDLRAERERDSGMTPFVSSSTCVERKTFLYVIEGDDDKDTN